MKSRPRRRVAGPEHTQCLRAGAPHVVPAGQVLGREADWRGVGEQEWQARWNEREAILGVELDGEVSLLVADEDLAGKSATVVLLSTEGSVVAKADTRIGG